ncbi:MetS family NSS transporter small subunit [Marinoscillum pacificum]|nr:MetS family NSS transporter small subunit [Marinoscillum pacificum]
MSISSIISMICTVSIILGGFVYFLVLAMRNEKSKNG